MLENLRWKISRSARKSFNKRFVDYMVEIHETNLVLELDYIKKHNDLDVFKLNKVISQMIEDYNNDNL